MRSTSTTRTWEAERGQRQREERELFERFVRDRDAAARAALVERFLPLARQLARRYRGRAEDIEDLEQVAAVGLLTAIDRFDPQRGPAFSSFAFPTILGEIRRHFRDLSWSMRVPRDVQDLFLRLERISREMAGELGRGPTVAELAARSEATVEQVLEALEARSARRPISLDEPGHNSDETDAGTRDVAVEDPGFAAAETVAALDDLMRVLSARDRLILNLRFREDRLQWQIAEVMGISQMHVSRVIHGAIERLQHAVESRSALADRVPSANDAGGGLEPLPPPRDRDEPAGDRRAGWDPRTSAAQASARRRRAKHREAARAPSSRPS